MDFAAINWLAVLAAALIGFVVGGLWYGPLFGAAWMRSIGIDPEAVKNAPKDGMRRILSLSFVLQWIIAVNLALFFGEETTAATGAWYGFHAGLFWVAAALTVKALYESKPASYIAINAGYWTVTFTLMGLVLGAWH